MLLPVLLAVALYNPPPAVEPAHVDALWEFVQTLVGPLALAPEVYFTAEDDPPVTLPFLAFYYEHTRVLRIVPRAWREGVTGRVYVIVGHEMLHYCLVDRVPVPEHHCLIAHEKYERRIASFLVARGAAHPFLERGPFYETCEEDK